MNCRHCSALLSRVVIDLGFQPPSNAYLDVASVGVAEAYSPLKVYVCENCWLVQLPAHHRAEELFTPDYAYFSSVSESWVGHARNYVAAIVDRFALSPKSCVVEVASNDGYLLQFVKDAGLQCYGIEPTASTAAAARARGIETLEIFFGEQVARNLVAQRGPADLIIANNVLAHVPDINDFVAGFRELLAQEGVATFEFPHVMKLVDELQFDTIYHEHYSYLSLTSVRTIFESCGLRVFDVEELPTHGGSLRVFASRRESTTNGETPRVRTLMNRERSAGIQTVSYYVGVATGALRIKQDLLDFLIDQSQRGRLVAAYGAAAKGNTLLNFASVRSNLLAFVCDAAPSKQGRFLPGSHIPILPPSAIDERRPDIILILPWNLRDEIAVSLSRVREWGAQFAIAVPRLEVF